MSLDYDLYVIDSTNLDTSMHQLRDCLKDAIAELAKRTASLSDRLDKLENEAAVADNKALSEEPLIPYEKVRKAVRAWAEENNISKMKVAPFAIFDVESTASIYFRRRIVEDNSYDEFRYYTVTELCGEEKAPEPLEPSFIDLAPRIKEKPPLRSSVGRRKNEH